jgi:hypothetical protein
MVDNGRSEFSKRMTDKEIAIETLNNFLTLLWPGQTGPEKRFRQLAFYNITGTLSQTELEKRTSLALCEFSAAVIAAVAERIKGGGEFPDTEKDLLDMIDTARQDVAQAENQKQKAQIAQKTLLEKRLEKTVEIARKGPAAYREQTARTAAEMGD